MKPANADVQGIEELEQKEVRTQGNPSRTAVLKEIIFHTRTLKPRSPAASGFLYAAMLPVLT